MNKLMKWYSNGMWKETWNTPITDLLFSKKGGGGACIAAVFLITGVRKNFQISLILTMIWVLQNQLISELIRAVSEILSIESDAQQEEMTLTATTHQLWCTVGSKFWKGFYPTVIGLISALFISWNMISGFYH